LGLGNAVTKKLQIQGVNTRKKSYSKNGVAIVEEGDAGELYLAMKLDGIDKFKIFFIFCFLFQVDVV